MKKRCVSIILILAILSSFIIVPASASGESRSSSSASGVVINSDAVTYWNSRFSVWYFDLLPVGSDCSQSRWKDMCWATMDYAMSQYGSFSSLAQLTQYSWQVRTRLRNTKVSQIDRYLNETPNMDSHRPNISSVISGYKQPSKSAQSIEITGFIEKSKPSQIIFLYTLLPLTA